MAYNGLAEVLSGEQTVTVPNSKFESLVRESEQIRILKELNRSRKNAHYVDLVVLDLNKESEEE